MNKTIAAVILMAVAGTVHAGDFTLDGVKAGEVRGVAFEMSAPAAERVYTSAQAAITMAEREYLLRSDVRASGLAWQLMANDGVQDPQLTPKVFASYYRKAASKMAAKPEAGAPSPAATEAAVALLKKYCEIYDAAAKKARTLDEFQALTDGSVTEIYNVAGKARTYGELFNGVAGVTFKEADLFSRSKAAAPANLRLAEFGSVCNLGKNRGGAVANAMARLNAPVVILSSSIGPWDGTNYSGEYLRAPYRIMGEATVARVSVLADYGWMACVPVKGSLNTDWPADYY